MKRILILILCILMICALTQTAGCFASASTDHMADGRPPIQILTDRESLPALCREDLLEIHFLNVGAADCILLRMGNSAVLIDGGRSATAAEAVSYLKEIGVETLDCVFATHPHDDHIGGLPGILSEIPAGALYQAGFYEDYQSQARWNLQAALDELHIMDSVIPTEWSMRLGEAELTFYQWQNPEAAQNDRSVAIKVKYGERSALLAADLENSGQKAVAAQYGEALRADILKMPHHGIGTYQLPFHEAVQPLFGVVTNSKNGAQGMIDRMTRNGMQWMVTTRGTVVAVTDGNVWSVWQVTERK